MAAPQTAPGAEFQDGGKPVAIPVYQVDGSGNPLANSGAAAVTSVNAVASDTPLLAANANRRAAYFFNDSTAILYLLFGTGTASTTNYSVQIPGQGFFEVPSTPIYTGGFHGIWSAANGAVRMTELT